MSSNQLRSALLQTVHALAAARVFISVLASVAILAVGMARLIVDLASTAPRCVAAAL